MLKQRVITALVLVAAFVWLLVNLTAAEFSLVLLLLVMVGLVLLLTLSMCKYLFQSHKLLKMEIYCCVI